MGTICSLIAYLLDGQPSIPGALLVFNSETFLIISCDFCHEGCLCTSPFKVNLVSLFIS